MGLFKEFDNVSYQDWLNIITADLKGKDYQQTLVWNSLEGIEVQPFYNFSSLSNNISSLCSPIRESSSWKIRESIFINTIKEANIKAIKALKGGANSILFIGEIKNQQEMEALLKNIDINIIEIHFYNYTPNYTLSLINSIKGSISYDYLGELYLSGKWNSSIENDLIELATITKKESDIITITVKGINYNNSGATIIQELAFSLSQGVEYLNFLSDQGISVTELANKIQFSFGIRSNYFFEIAKIRAARILWKLILQQYETEDVENMTIHSETSNWNITKKESHLNILRTTTEAMAAIMGGCDSLTVLPYDNRVDFSDRIARNIQHILKEESFLNKVKNPADGSYYIEKLTDEIAKQSWNLFQKIEQKGGFLSCIENNFIINEINSSIDNNKLES
jgi:methylmalonyl-CoA mutase